MHFIRFTFFAVDKDYLRSKHWQVIHCSDGPDFGEADDIALKHKRTSMADAVETLCSMELLISTMSEVHHPSGRAINVQPQPMLIPLQDKPNLSRVGTPNEGRTIKKKATSNLGSTLDEVLEKTRSKSK